MNRFEGFCCWQRELCAIPRLEGADRQAGFWAYGWCTGHRIGIWRLTRKED